jgi:hypothetical protein
MTPKIAPAMHVVPVADKTMIAETIAAHQAWLNGTLAETAKPPALWTAGTAQELPAGLPAGFIVDLAKLRPEVKYLLFFMTAQLEPQAAGRARSTLTGSGQAAAIAAAMRERGRAPRAGESACEEPDIVNAPYLGRIAKCQFQHRHRGPHSWIDDSMGPRAPDEHHRSEKQRAADYAQSRAQQRNRP